MPKVPTLDRNRISQQPLSMGRIKAQDFSNQGAINKTRQAADQLNQYRMKVEEKERRKADELALLDVDQQLSKLETQMLYDPQNGAMNKRGKDSFALPDTIIPEFDKKIGEIEQGLSSDFQRLSFQKMVARRRGHIDRQIQRHVAAETRRYDDQVTKDYVANEMNAAIENFHDPERIELALDRQKGAILSHAKRNGLSKESTDRLLEDTQSKTHKSVFSKILNSGGVTSAQQYYKQYKDQISGEDRVSIDKALKEGLIDQKSMLASDRLYEKYSDNMTEALAQANKIQDAEQRAETKRKLKNRFQDQRIAEQEESRQSFNSAYDTLETNGGNIDAIPKALWAELEPSKKETLKKIANNIKYGSGETDWDTFYNLKMMASNPATRDDFKRLNLTEYFDKLKDSEKKTLINLQTKANDPSDKLLDGIQTHTQIVNGVLQSVGMDKKDERVPLFRRKLDELVVQKQQASGREVTNDEVQELADQLMMDVVTKPGWIWDTTKKRFEVEPNESYFIRFEDIPTNDRIELKRALEARGRDSSDEAVVEAYTQYLRRRDG